MTAPRFAIRGVGLAAAMACAGAAHAVIAISGNTNAWPGNAPIGPGDTDLGNAAVFVGSGGPGSLTADGGSQLRTGSLLIGPSPLGNGDGVAVFSGIGTRVELVGDGFSDGVLNRLSVGEWGKGSLTVAAGAVLDGRANASACLGVNHYCNNFIGNAAGSDATFTVTGAGSQASFLRYFGVGGLAVFHPPIDSFTFGTPGGTTVGRVNVLAGGLLTTDGAALGLAPGGSSPLGNERSFAEALISGAGSVWRLTGGTLEPAAANLSTATHRNAWATVSVKEGGTLRLEGSGDAYLSVGLTTGGGRTDALVSGSGSNISFAAQSGVLQVGLSLGSATLDVRDGGLVDNVFYGSVGRNGSFGTLNIDGGGSLYRANSTATAAANGVTGAAVFDIGRAGGNGTVNVSNGGRLEVTATTATTNGVALSVGRDAASAGTLNIASGGTVLLSAASVAPDSAGEAWNPFVRIGRDGSGTLNISGGGKLLVEGNAVSTVANTRRTSVFIGGSGDASIGGKGVATISGAGSELRVSGSDAYIGVGHGPQAVGNLSVTNQAAIGATILGIGNYGGTGIAKFDNASINLTGQYTGSGEFGAALVIGAGSGAVGNVTATGGSVIRVSSLSTLSGGITIGGSRSLSGGDGALTLNASSLLLDLPSNVGGLTVGRTGSGLLRLQSGSVVDLGANNLVVSAFSGADGTVIATGGSTISAGWVGVGRRRDAATGDTFDGGTATMVLNGATLNAQDVVIGSNGFLGGTEGSINVSGSIVNYGIFSPGNSPGLFSINGNYVAGAGSRLILEVQSDGAGGFAIDEVRFGAGGAIDLAALDIEFRFLGDTDPNAFQDSGGFDIDSFVRQADASGALAGLDASEYANVSFAARADAYTISDFSYSADGGAVFSAVPVPEPSSWLMLAGGLAWLARRRLVGRA